MRVQASVCVWEASGERGQRPGKARRRAVNSVAAAACPPTAPPAGAARPRDPDALPQPWSGARREGIEEGA